MKRYTPLIAAAALMLLVGCNKPIRTEELSTTQASTLSAVVPLTKAEFKERLPKMSYRGHEGQPGTLRDAALIEAELLKLVGKNEMQARSKDGDPGLFILVFKCTDGEMEIEMFPYLINDVKVLGVAAIRGR